MTLVLDMYASAGLGVVALLLGMFFTRKIPFLRRYCIPAPVSGGLLVSLATLLLYIIFGLECSFDPTVKDFCMMLFFTSVGFQCDLKQIRKGGRPLVVLTALVAVLIVVQNLISLGIAKGLALDPLVGMASGSIPMSGGHGTSGGFAPLLEQMGLTGASSITMAAATFGLVAGSLLGGPLGEALIRRHHLAEPSSPGDVLASVEAGEASEAAREERSLSKEGAFRGYLVGACMLLIAMALGSGVNRLLALTGITFPTYFGSLLAACALRNTVFLSGKLASKFSVGEVVSIGDISLQLFLGMAMASLRLWELASLALPLALILAAQVLFMAGYAAFVAFPLLGRNYDGAVMVSGLCGFGLGATPNAMANMSAVCFKYRYAVNPFIVVPIIGAMFLDIINTGVITLFLNLIH
ncbi:MAG: sodium/glutamate symporter [Bacteroidales bacterium]|nr:sodium/glutamate symporter [Bacteroidales bacterium]MBO7480024.1 sodium/glutamate symporter [Bacteroidales bacterium]MBO7488523.1 sodium/glutamate symporter [Bacteroidales bacterium]